MSEKMVEEMARAIDEALPESGKSTLAPSQIRRAARAAASIAQRRIDELTEALSGLVQAVEMDSHENNGISGYTGARLSDASAALNQERASEKG